MMPAIWRVPVVALVACLAVAPAAVAQGLGVFAGSWLLHQDRSSYEPLTNRPDRRLIVIAVKDQQLSVRTENTRTVNFETFTTHTTYTAQTDGRDYAVPNSNNRVAFRIVDATTLERTARAGDQGRETATWTLSADGRMLTITSDGVDSFGVVYTSTQVFDRIDRP